MKRLKDDILSYREMCDAEDVQTLQRGMNYRLNPSYSVILMSQRMNAPYNDRLHDDGITIEYEGHDVSRKDYMHNPKLEDQTSNLPSGILTQNGKFIKAIEGYKRGSRLSEPIKAYEKIMPGVWSLKGIFDLIDYKIVHDGNRNVFRFILRLSNNQRLIPGTEKVTLTHTRLIPTEVKMEVWKRDGGKCVLCEENKNLHFDHDLPYSKGGTSLSVKNVKLLCMKHNLSKSNNIQ
jgi:hypothetical protein